MRVEDLEYEVEMEREEAEKALDKSKEWRERQMTKVVEKHDVEVRELLEQIKILERNSSNTEKKLNYQTEKELPALPKQEKISKLQKFKQLVSKTKEKTKEKFQAFVIQKNT